MNATARVGDPAGPRPRHGPPRGPRLGAWQAVLTLARLARAGNVILLGASVYLSALFLLEYDPGDHTPTADELLVRLADGRLLIAAVATACVAAGGYLINDYFDVRIDRINRPGRTHLDGGISRRRMLVAHALLTGVAILLSATIGWRLLALTTLSALALWRYSSTLKRTPGWGNGLVAGLSAAALGVPCLALGAPPTPALGAFMLFCLLSQGLREVIKDMEDMPGDAADGCRTLPLVLGLPMARGVVYLLAGLLAAAMIGISPWLGKALFFYNLTVLTTLGVIVYRLSRADRRAHFAHLSRLSKLLLGQGMLGMLLVPFR